MGDEYTYTKIVAWLLNRPVDSQKSERDGFFKKLNISLANQFKDLDHTGSNPNKGGGSNLHFDDTQGDIYDVSLGQNNLTGRTPTNMLNSTLTREMVGGTSVIGGQQKNVQFTVKEEDGDV